MEENRMLLSKFVNQKVRMILYHLSVALDIITIIYQLQKWLKAHLLKVEHIISGSCNPNFVDYSGNSCQYYADKKWCTSDGKYGESWDMDWGDGYKFDTFEVLDETALVCPQCGCKGGCGLQKKN